MRIYIYIYIYIEYIFKVNIDREVGECVILKVQCT